MQIATSITTPAVWRRRTSLVETRSYAMFTTPVKKNCSRNVASSASFVWGTLFHCNITLSYGKRSSWCRSNLDKTTSQHIGVSNHINVIESSLLPKTIRGARTLILFRDAAPFISFSFTGKCGFVHLRRVPRAHCVVWCACFLVWCPIFSQSFVDHICTCVRFPKTWLLHMHSIQRGPRFHIT